VVARGRWWRECDFKYEIVIYYKNKTKTETANNLALIARSSYCVAGNNDLRDYESRRSGKKLIVDITGWPSRVYFFAHEVMSVLVHENVSCYLKKFRAIICKNFILCTRHQFGECCRVYNEMYTRTRTVSKGVYTKICTYGGLWSNVLEKTATVDRLTMVNCDSIVWTTSPFVPTRHYSHFVRIRHWHSQETIMWKKNVHYYFTRSDFNNIWTNKLFVHLRIKLFLFLRSRVGGCDRPSSS